MNLHYPQQPFASVWKCVLKRWHRALNHMLKLYGIRRDLQKVNFKLGLALTLLLTAILLPGCAVVNPNVTLERPGSESKNGSDAGIKEKTVGKPDSETKNNSEEIRQYTLSQGIQYAEGAIEKYDNYISSNNWFRGTIGVLMIGASAAALALGITDGGTTAITALGVSGASLFGIGTFLSDSSRNAIYNEGKEKVICAIAAVQPLFLPTEKITQFRKALENVNKGIPQVQEAMERVNREKETVKDSQNSTVKDLLKLVPERIISANAAIKVADAAYEAGTKVDLQVFRAGNTLITAVDGINVEVNKRLAGTVSNLEAANTIIGGLATVSTQLSMIPKEELKETARATLEQSQIEEKATDPNNFVAIPDPGKNLVAALNALAVRTVSLSREVAVVATIVAEIEPSLVNLGQCKLNLQELTLAVKPESIEFTENNLGTRRLIILTGKKPFAAQLLEHPVKGLTIEQPIPFGSTVEVKATPEVAGGKYNLHIVDGAERHVFIKVEVKEPVEEIEKKKAVEDKAVKTPSQSQTKPKGGIEKPNSGKSK